MNWRDFGFNSMMMRGIPESKAMSSIEVLSNIPIGGLNISQVSALLNATTNIVFSSTDYNTAAWTTGTIYFSDGSDSGTIDAGNTGNITATTYVYYDREQLGILQTTTTPSSARGINKLLVAIIGLGESGKDCKITPTIASGLTVSGITASQITAGTITGAEIHAGAIDTDQLAAEAVTATKIEAGTITANEISGNQLDVVAANTGTLNVDEYITLGSDANVKIDGTNKRIIINDGINDRILIGYQESGF